MHHSDRRYKAATKPYGAAQAAMNSHVLDIDNPARNRHAPVMIADHASNGEWEKAKPIWSYISFN